MTSPDPHVLPVADPAAFGRACAALLEATEIIHAQMRPAVDAKSRNTMDVTLQHGGTVCVESSADVVGATRVALTCVAPSGARIEIASAYVRDRPAP